MNSINKLFRSTIKQQTSRLTSMNRMSLIRISSFKYFTSSEMKIDTRLNKKDNIDLFGECECGRSIFQQWRSCHPVYVLGNKICEECGSGCVEYVNQQYGDIKLNKCCNQNCVTNKVSNSSFLDNPTY